MTTIAVLFKNKENGSLFVANSRQEAENFIKSNWGENEYSLKHLTDLYDYSVCELISLKWNAKRIEY